MDKSNCAMNMANVNELEKVKKENVRLESCGIVVQK